MFLAVFCLLVVCVNADDDGKVSYDFKQHYMSELIIIMDYTNELNTDCLLDD